MEKLLKNAKALLPTLIAHRRYLHTHAEVGFHLEKTKQYVKNVLKEIGLSPVDCGKAGIYADIQGNQPGKTLLLRADMDALPLQEETGLEYSCNEGAMHACGHDMHSAMLLGAAMLLVNYKAKIKGNLRLMFQGAEEIFQGAKDMCENGVLAPKPDFGIMLHVLSHSECPCGTVILPPEGVSAPSADAFTLTIIGQACHGSTPHNGIDALSAGARILLATEELPARELPAAEQTVLTLGRFLGGKAVNAIADKAVLQGTLRTFSEETRSFTLQRISQITQGLSQAFRCHGEFAIDSSCPCLFNDAQVLNTIKLALQELMGKERVISSQDKGGGSEDFAYISQQIPCAMIALSAGMENQGEVYPLHHPKVMFQEDTLSLGAAIYATCALTLLS